MIYLTGFMGSGKTSVGRRLALKLGLQLEQELGTNPYKFGMIGSTDAHTGLATAEENNFYGKASKWHAIYDANRDVIGDNPDKIFPGQVLKIPAIED